MTEYIRMMGSSKIPMIHQRYDSSDTGADPQLSTVVAPAWDIRQNPPLPAGDASIFSREEMFGEVEPLRLDHMWSDFF